MEQESKRKMHYHLLSQSEGIKERMTMVELRDVTIALLPHVRFLVKHKSSM